jgi:membrane-associated protease RseP (regulator of RpoE activity)
MNEPMSMPEPSQPGPISAAFPAAAAAESTAGPGPRVPQRMLDECDLRSPRIRRRVVVPVLLFIAACFTTFAAGAYGWRTVGLDDTFLEFARSNWRQGLEYMTAVMAILLAHEMGHFLMTVRYRIPASYPIFLPLPIMVTGTMGAVIGMDGRQADRKQLFDVGIAGPLAGLVLAVPLICFGMRTAQPAPAQEPPDGTTLVSPISAPTVDPTQARLGQPIAVKLLRAWLRPEIGSETELAPNALYMAGWFGLLLTGLNMMPISQLDGGHVTYGMFGRGSRWIGRSLLIAAIAFIIITQEYSWTLMLLLVIFLGTDHPPTANDRVRIGPWRWALGLASLVIPILCFTPVPLLND